MGKLLYIVLSCILNDYIQNCMDQMKVSSIVVLNPQNKTRRNGDCGGVYETFIYFLFFFVNLSFYLIG